eukprot:66266_1
MDKLRTILILSLANVLHTETEVTLPAECSAFNDGTRITDLVILNDMSADLGNNDLCDFFVAGPHDIINEGQIKGHAEVRIGETMEVEFDFKLNNECSAECVILRIGSEQNEKYPLIVARPDTDSDGLIDLQFMLTTYNGESIMITRNIVPLADDIYHHIYVHWSFTNIRAEFDGRGILNQDGDFAHIVDTTNYFDDITNPSLGAVKMNVYAGDPIGFGYEVADGILKNICIKTSWMPIWAG